MGHDVGMTSWRDTASPQAQDDLDGLLNAALPFAQQQLDAHGEFFPYGIVIERSGSSRLVAGDPDGSDRPASLDVLAVIMDGLRSERDVLRAVAVVSDVRLADSDAIRVELEHREGPVMAVLLPYRLSGGSAPVEYGGIAAAATRAQVWPAQT